MINTFSITRLSNPVHLQFMDYVVTLVSDKNPTALNVKPQHDLLSQKVTELKDLYKAVQGSPISEQIIEADALRDQIMTGIVKVVEANTYHYDEHVRVWAHLLKNNIRVYGDNLVRNDFQTETAKIESIANDWRTKPELLNAMTMLEMNEWMIELENANREFKRLYALRTEEISQKSEETMQTKRVEVNAAYTDLCKYLNSFAVINSSNPAYEVVISGINAYVDQYATLLKQKRSRTKVTENIPQ